MTLLIVLVLSVALITLTLWLLTVQHEAKNYMMRQLSSKDTEIQRLTTLLVSRDPMTFQMLSQGSEVSTFEPYVSTGSDEAEYAKWMAVGGRSPDVDEELNQDLVDMGL